MDAMDVYARREQIGIAPQSERGQVAAVTSAPESDAFAVHVAAGLQIFSSGHDVLVFFGAAARAARGFAKGAAVTDSAAVIQREHHVTAAGEILIHGVGIRVVVHVMPAEEHLAHGAAM